MNIFKKDELKLLWPIYISILFGSILFLYPIFYVLYFREIGFSLTQIGFLASAFFIANILFEIPTGVIADLFGRKFSVITGYILAGIAMTLIMFSNNFYIILALFFLGRLLYLQVVEGEVFAKRSNQNRLRQTLVFADRGIKKIVANKKRCLELLEKSTAYSTLLTPRLGYDTVSKIVKEAITTDRTLRQIILEKKILSEIELNKLLLHSCLDPGLTDFPFPYILISLVETYETKFPLFMSLKKILRFGGFLR